MRYVAAAAPGRRSQQSLSQGLTSYHPDKISPHCPLVLRGTTPDVAQSQLARTLAYLATATPASALTLLDGHGPSPARQPTSPGQEYALAGRRNRAVPTGRHIHTLLQHRLPPDARSTTGQSKSVTTLVPGRGAGRARTEETDPARV